MALAACLCTAASVAAAQPAQDPRSLLAAAVFFLTGAEGDALERTPNGSLRLRGMHHLVRLVPNRDCAVSYMHADDAGSERQVTFVYFARMHDRLGSISTLADENLVTITLSGQRAFCHGRLPPAPVIGVLESEEVRPTCQNEMPLSMTPDAAHVLRRIAALSYIWRAHCSPRRAPEPTEDPPY